jgi:Winged helix DNA-binding domain
MTADAAWLTRKRLDNQGLSRVRFRSAPEVVRSFVAVQSQDFGGAKWGVGQRLSGATDATVERAFDAGQILRTHVMRPTWHFVAPEDIRWLLALTAPRVHRFNVFTYRKYEMDARTITRSRDAMERALDAGGHLTRQELGAAIHRAKIPFDGVRLAHLVMHAELEAAICSGPRRGKQFTYALTEHRAPRAQRLTRDESLAELTRRYFSSHGPATGRDFAWWSGLTLADARDGLAALGGGVERETIGALTYWFVPSRLGARPSTPLVHLLPNYDEGLIAYKDRDLPGGLPAPIGAARYGNFPHHMVVEGRLAGAWRRTVKAREVVVDVLPYRAMTRAEIQSLKGTIARYGEFMALPARLRVLP